MVTCRSVNNRTNNSQRTPRWHVYNYKRFVHAILIKRLSSTIMLFNRHLLVSRLPHCVIRDLHFSDSKFKLTQTRMAYLKNKTFHLRTNDGSRWNSCECAKNWNSPSSANIYTGFHWNMRIVPLIIARASSNFSRWKTPRYRLRVNAPVSFGRVISAIKNVQNFPQFQPGSLPSFLFAREESLKWHRARVERYVGIRSRGRGLGHVTKGLSSRHG